MRYPECIGSGSPTTAPVNDSNSELICAVKEQIEPWFIRTNTLRSKCNKEGKLH